MSSWLKCWHIDTNNKKGKGAASIIKKKCFVLMVMT